MDCSSFELVILSPHQLALVLSVINNCKSLDNLLWEGCTYLNFMRWLGLELPTTRSEVNKVWLPLIKMRFVLLFWKIVIQSDFSKIRNKGHLPGDFTKTDFVGNFRSSFWDWLDICGLFLNVRVRFTRLMIGTHFVYSHN